jgi:hypothetical protein
MLATLALKQLNQPSLLLTNKGMKGIGTKSFNRHIHSHIVVVVVLKVLTNFVAQFHFFGTLRLISFSGIGKSMLTILHVASKYQMERNEQGR